MSTTKEHLKDRDIEQIMGNLLRYGVLTSMVVVLIGAVFYLWQHGHDQPWYREFKGEPKRFIQIREVWQAALKGKGRSIIQFGLFVLIATPIARIVFSVIGYIIEKDYLYILITLLVLSVIIYSF